MKRWLSLLFVLLILSTISVTSFADTSISAKAMNEEISVHESDRPTRQEETEWHFRTYLGRRQMRLWSVTYGYWLTDWIDIGPA